MQVKSVKISDDRLHIIGEQQEFYLKDGTYRNEHGETITIQGNQIVKVFTVPDVKVASKSQLEDFLKDLGEQIESARIDDQLARVALQEALQNQSQLYQTLSNLMKMHHDTLKSIIQNMK